MLRNVVTSAKPLCLSYPRSTTPLRCTAATGSFRIGVAITPPQHHALHVCGSSGSMPQAVYHAPSSLSYPLIITPTRYHALYMPCGRAEVLSHLMVYHTPFAYHRGVVSCVTYGISPGRDDRRSILSLSNAQILFLGMLQANSR